MSKLKKARKRIQKAVRLSSDTLDLSGLKLTTADLRTLMLEIIQQLPDLAYLDLSNNRITELPAGIGQLQQLTNLNVSQNRLTRLPAEIGQLEELTELIASDNQITELPAEMINLKRLMTLALDNNSFENFNLPGSDNIAENFPDLVGLSINNKQLSAQEKYRIYNLFKKAKEHLYLDIEEDAEKTLSLDEGFVYDKVGAYGVLGANQDDDSVDLGKFGTSRKNSRRLASTGRLSLGSGFSLTTGSGNIPSL